ncbi:MAG TPA: Imm8 family immunity protein [Gemmatimonadales bacterium]|nr:Imm8 family immunity protein [Gemmatimonadales bacterium]
MIHPELRDIWSPDLAPPELPPDPVVCAVRFDARIAPREDAAAPAETYGFLVVTPAQLRALDGPTWGRGLLIVERFEWAVVIQAVAELLARCARPTWAEVRAELQRELHRQAP